MDFERCQHPGPCLCRLSPPAANAKKPQHGLSEKLWSGLFHQNCWLSSCTHRHPAANAQPPHGRSHKLPSRQCTHRCWPSSCRNQPPTANVRFPHGRSEMPASVDLCHCHGPCQGARAAATALTCLLVLSLGQGYS